MSGRWTKTSYKSRGNFVRASSSIEYRVPRRSGPLIFIIDPASPAVDVNYGCTEILVLASSRKSFASSSALGDILLLND